MPELATAAAPPRAEPGARVAAECARLGARLAALLERMPREDSRAAAAAAFLRRTAAASAAPGEPADDDPFELLSSALGASPLERELLLLAALPDEHEGYASVLRFLHPRGEPLPTVGLAAQLVCRDDAERGELRRVLELGAAAASGALHVAGDVPFHERSLRLAPGLDSVLRGVDALPAPLARHAPPPAAGLESWLASPAAVRAARIIRDDERCTIAVTADDASTALGRALALAATARRSALVLEGAPEPEGQQLLLVHAAARAALPVLVPGDDAAPRLDRFPGAVVVCTRGGSASPAGGRPLVALSAEPLDPPARRRMWAATLPELDRHAPLLAARHPLEPGLAAHVAVDVRALRSPAGPADVAAAIRARAGARLSAGVRLVRPTATWERLVLPPDRIAQLREAAARLELQSRVLDEWGFLEGRAGARGVRMLFAGPPGTGKSLSAEVLARELGVDLLSVDISRVVSKWIGETEKNLAEVFDAAERTQAVLLFDEADALFGKRTEVSDAHDRYANLETAYLLARLERFEGLAVLSTNLRQNIDPAFIRRLEFVVDFDAPETAERELLWRVHLPRRAPLADDVDPVELAHLYELVGGHIRNAAVAAAFLAAAEDRPVGRGHLLRAVRREYAKAGRAFPGTPDPAPAL